MPDITPATPVPQRFPLSVYQQTRFADLKAAADAQAAEYQKLADRQNEAATIVIAASVDPTTVAGWSIAIEATEIVCTPPVAPPVAP